MCAIKINKKWFRKRGIFDQSYFFCSLKWFILDDLTHGMHQLDKNHVFIFRCVEGGIKIERFGGAWRSREVILMIFWDVDKTNLTVAPGLGGFHPPLFSSSLSPACFTEFSPHIKHWKLANLSGNQLFFQAMFSWNGIISNKVDFFKHNLSHLIPAWGKWLVSRSKWTPTIPNGRVTGGNLTEVRHRRSNWATCTFTGK